MMIIDSTHILNTCTCMKTKCLKEKITKLVTLINWIILVHNGISSYLLFLYIYSCSYKILSVSFLYNSILLCSLSHTKSSLFEHAYAFCLFSCWLNFFLPTFPAISMILAFVWDHTATWFLFVILLFFSEGNKKWHTQHDFFGLLELLTPNEELVLIQNLILTFCPHISGVLYLS